MKIKSFVKEPLLIVSYITLLIACSDNKVDEQDTTTINLPPETEAIFEKGVNFTEASGSQQLSFTATGDWNITTAETRSGETWYRVHPSSGGAGKADVSILVEENTGYDNRSVAITINAGSFKKTLMVSQKQKNALTITSDRLEVEQKGGQISIEVKANVEYRTVVASDCQSWIVPVPTRGLSTTTTSFKVEMNEGREKREGEVYITDGILTEVVKVYQHGGSIVLLNENEYPVGDKGETIKVDLRSNCTYDVKMPDVDWIQEANMSRGMSSHTLYYTISPNETNDSRQAKIIFFDKENRAIADTLVVLQAQKDAVIISHKSIELNTPNDSVFAIDVNTNVNVEVHPADTCQWITESTDTRGMQIRKVYLKAAKNDGLSARRGRVLLKSKTSNACDTLKIWQAGKPTSVSLEQTTCTAPKEGGTFRIKIDANVDVRMEKWAVLYPEGHPSEAPPSSYVDEEYYYTNLFKYENKPELNYQATLSDDGKYLDLVVSPASSSQPVSATVTIYGAYENKEAQLTLNQDPDPTKITRLVLDSNGQQFFSAMLIASYDALQKMYTQEALYARTSETVTSSPYRWNLDFLNHSLDASSSEVGSAWNAAYKAINYILNFKHAVTQYSKQLSATDVSAISALLDMQCSSLYFEMVSLWGKAVYIDTYTPDLVSRPATSKNELLRNYINPLVAAREYLSTRVAETTESNRYFFPSQDYPSLLLARIYMETGDFSKAKELLVSVVNSKTYQPGDYLYKLYYSPMDQTPVNTSDVATVYYLYNEVLLNLAECEYHLGNSTKAEEYLHTVAAADLGSPAYTRTADGFINRLANTWKSQLEGTGTYFAFLKRNGIAEAALNIPDWRLVFPIPINQIMLNPQMSQNSGY